MEAIGDVCDSKVDAEPLKREVHTDVVLDLNLHSGKALARQQVHSWRRKEKAVDAARVDDKPLGPVLLGHCKDTHVASARAAERDKPNTIEFLDELRVPPTTAKARVHVVSGLSELLIHFRNLFSATEHALLEAPQKATLTCRQYCKYGWCPGKRARY